ncbi:MAG: aldehyde dehydrogenase family protein [Gammaproteobacteria bacterium]|nr:aldehyde dehydrogenase family protein [Gammaproteobacteria bacterium]
MQQTISPVDGRVYVERPHGSARDIEQTLATAVRAQRDWQQLGVAKRCALLGLAVDAFVSDCEAIAAEITWQMGRPISQTPGEVRGFEERARYMLSIAPEALAPIEPPRTAGFERWLERAPLGLVAVVAPWNYPYLTAVNAVIPALAAGNVVVLKHSHQTPLCAERFAAAFATAGLPPGVFQFLHLSHEDTARFIADPRVNFVCFTGSVSGGYAVQRALSAGFADSGLELGGKDPAYVRADADLPQAIDVVTDGAFFNSGQSCCGIERVYVHETVYDDFVAGVVAQVRKYRLGIPTDLATTLGPMVRASAAAFVREQVAEAVRSGARALVDSRLFPADAPGTPYLAPQVLVGVDHSMRIMTEETFGPAVGIMRVQSDDEALRLMNDSEYGLTAAVFTRDVGIARSIGSQIETGTVFLNRCDYLDPALAWTGVKNSGRGCTLSRIGYEHLTRPKSFHFRLPA